MIKKRRRNQARGAAWVAPPPPVRCTATPVAVTGWQWRRRCWVLAPSVAVYTALCTTVHHWVLSGATAVFFPRLAFLVLS